MIVYFWCNPGLLCISKQNQYLLAATYEISKSGLPNTSIIGSIPRPGPSGALIRPLYPLGGIPCGVSLVRYIAVEICAHEQVVGRRGERQVRNGCHGYVRPPHVLNVHGKAGAHTEIPDLWP